MKFQFFKLSAIALLTLNLVACGKDNESATPTIKPDMSEKFVGTYNGRYSEFIGFGNGASLDNIKATLKKKTATDVEVNVDVLGNIFVFNGVAQNDTLFNISKQPYNGSEIVSGTGILRNGNTISINMRVKVENSSDTAKVGFNGSR